MPSEHEKLIKLGVTLNYQMNADGCCHGVTLKWLEACLLGETERFNARMEKILTEPDELLITKINDTRAKVKTHEALNEEELHLLDILAFYEGINLYQSPSIHKAVFNQNLTQYDIDKLSFYASSLKIVDSGGLKTIYSEPGIYTEEEFIAYLEKLQCIFREEKQSRGLLLSSHNHSIGLFYDAITDAWRVMDVNQWPSTTFSQLQIAKRLWKAFNTRRHSLYVGFNAQIIAPSCQEYDPIKFNHLRTQRLARINLELAKRTTDSGVTLLFLAIKYRYLDVGLSLIKVLVEHGDIATLELPGPEGYTPLLVATELGYLDMVKALVKALEPGHASALNAPTPDGATPLFMAAQIGHADVVDVFIEAFIRHGNIAALTMARPDRSTPLYIAAQNGHLAVVRAFIEAFIKHGHIAALAMVRLDYSTPLYVAAQNGHLGVVRALIEAFVKHGEIAVLTIARSDYSTPLYIAAQNGHAGVVGAFIEAFIMHGNIAALNMVRPDGSTPLYIAAQNGHLGVVRAFIEAFIKHGNVVALNRPGFKDITPVYIALSLGHIAIVNALIQALVNYGDIAALNADGANGFTPFDILNALVNEGYFETAYILLQKLSAQPTSILMNTELLNAFIKRYPPEELNQINKITLKKMKPSSVTISITPEELGIIAGKNVLPAVYEERFAILLAKLKAETQLLPMEPRYKKIRDKAIWLHDRLETVGNEFFKKPSMITERDFNRFNSACQEAIKMAHKEFQKHRDVWYQLHPVIRGILGVLAAISIIPALVTAATHNGFLGTFFSEPETSEAKQLGSFRTETNDLICAIEISVK